MDVNDDEPEDVKKATSVEKEIKKGVKDDTFEGQPRFDKKTTKWRHCETDKKGKNKQPAVIDAECCQRKKDEADAKKLKRMTVIRHAASCTFPKLGIQNRDELSKQQYIDMLAIPSRKCPLPCFGHAVIERLRPVSDRIKQLARPPRHRLLMTLQDAATTLPPALLDNLIKNLEGDTCLTPEQAEKAFRRRKRKASRSRRSEKGRRKDRKVKGDGPTTKKPRLIGTGVFDKESVTCQYLMAERFVKSILEWKCPIPKEEFSDISQVILKRLAYTLEYDPGGDEDRKSQQMRFLADLIACWISGVIIEVTEARRKIIEEECERRRKEREAEEMEREVEEWFEEVEELPSEVEEEEEEEEVEWAAAVEEEEQLEEYEEREESMMEEGQEVREVSEAEGLDAVPSEVSQLIPSEMTLAEQQTEAELAEAERLEAERLEAERLEAERLEAERLEAERLEAERLEAERLEAEEQEQEEEQEEMEEDRVETQDSAVQSPTLSSVEVETKTDASDSQDGGTQTTESERTISAVQTEEDEEAARIAAELALEEERRKALEEEMRAKGPAASLAAIGDIGDMFNTDVPFVTFAKIMEVIHQLLEDTCESAGDDPLINRVHRAIYDKFTTLISKESPELLTEKLKVLLNIVSSKIATWLRTILRDSQITLMQMYPPEVESGELRGWSKWLMYVSDAAVEWNTWLHEAFVEAEKLREAQISRGEWQEWTSHIDTGALQWRRFHLETRHQAQRNITMMTERTVVKTGTKTYPPLKLPVVPEEELIETTELSSIISI